MIFSELLQSKPMLKKEKQSSCVYLWSITNWHPIKAEQIAGVQVGMARWVDIITFCRVPVIFTTTFIKRFLFSPMNPNYLHLIHIGAESKELNLSTRSAEAVGKYYAANWCSALVGLFGPLRCSRLIISTTIRWIALTPHTIMVPRGHFLYWLLWSSDFLDGIDFFEMCSWHSCSPAGWIYSNFGNLKSKSFICTTLGFMAKRLQGKCHSHQPQL